MEKDQVFLRIGSMDIPLIDTMEKKRSCGDKDLTEAVLVGILLRLPVVSLLRFKAVSRFWLALIQKPYFIHDHTTLTNFKLSSSRFGSFIVPVAVQFPNKFRENALLMLSSESDECVSRPRSWCSESFGLWSTGSNGICGQCVYEYELPGSGGGGGWWWRTSDGLCYRCPRSNDFVEEDNQNLKSFLKGGGGEGELSNELVLKFENLGFPSCYNFGKPPTKVMVVGSCNGLICLYDEQSDQVSLWNPATRQFRILPKASSSITNDGAGCLHRLYAFGFDAETGDYMVVLLSGFGLRPKIIYGGLSGPVELMECIFRVQVYTLSTDHWLLLDGINVLPGSPFLDPLDSSSCGQLLYLNGRCFFMANFLHHHEEEEEEQCILSRDDYRFIISLDLTKSIITDESIIPIQLPGYYSGKEYLCYLGKKIALITTKVDRGWQFFHICVLNEHGSISLNYKSWTILHCFRIKHVLPGEWIIPRGISNDGVFVFLETGIHGLGNKKKMKLYNLVTKEVKENFIYCDQVMSKAYAYKPSLVSVIRPHFE